MSNDKAYRHVTPLPSSWKCLEFMSAVPSCVCVRFVCVFIFVISFKLTTTDDLIIHCQWPIDFSTKTYALMKVERIINGKYLFNCFRFYKVQTIFDNFSCVLKFSLKTLFLLTVLISILTISNFLCKSRNHQSERRESFEISVMIFVRIRPTKHLQPLAMGCSKSRLVNWLVKVDLLYLNFDWSDAFYQITGGKRALTIRSYIMVITMSHRN